MQGSGAEAPAPSAPVKPSSKSKVTSLQSGLVTSQRDYYQTRAVLRLSVKDSAEFSAGDVVVFDATSRQVVASRISETAGGASSFKMNASGGYEVQLFPNHPSTSGAFNYGENVLKFLVDSGDEHVEVGRTTFVLRDFSLFNVTTARFVNNVQSTQGFQGWTNMVIKPVVSNNGSLTTGFGTLINE